MSHLIMILGLMYIATWWIYYAGDGSHVMGLICMLAMPH